MALALMLGAAMFLLGGFVAPSSASALVYPGEALVETIPGGGAGDELTGPAKTILQRPTFLAGVVDDAAAAGGAAEASGVAGIFEGAGLIPGVGLAIGSFTAGVGIGSIICNAVFELEGCLKLSSTGANTAPGTGSWKWQQAGCDSRMPTYAWYWAAPIETSPTCPLAIFNVAGNHETCGFKGPAGGYAFYPQVGHEKETCGSGPEAKEYFFESGSLVKDAMANRDFAPMTKAEAAGSGLPTYTGTGYCPAEEPKTCTKTPSTNWAERAARMLHNSGNGISEATRTKLGESIAAEIPGSGVQSPYKTYVKVPECSGEVWIGCKSFLEELQLVPERQEVNWSEVETTVPGQVVELAPVPGTEVVTKTKVVVKTNPDTSQMPLVVPKPGAHETYSEYIARLAPGLKPQRLTVSESSADTSHGPDGVLAVSPEGGTKLNPNVEHEVEVKTNPATTPYVPGGGCEATVGAIDWTPLNQPLGSRFPFGVFAFFVAWIGEWTASEVPPEWEVTVLPPMFGGDGLKIKIDLESMAPVAEVARVAFVFVSFVGLLWFLGTAAMKVQGDTS